VLETTLPILSVLLLGEFKMTRLELIGMRKFLLENPTEWFDYRGGHENMEAHAWRAIAYHLAGVEGEAKDLLDKISPSVPNIM
jgi:hypothetical protein